MSLHTIMIVEDNPTLRKLFRVALECEGLHVIEAPDGRTAIDYMQHGAPDLILQDLCLPDMPGIDLAREFRRLPGGRDTPIIALSGFLERMDEARSLDVGFTAFLLKPIEPSRLVEEIRTYVPFIGRADSALGRGRRVLIVDDDPLQLKLLRLELASHGFAISTSPDGKRALAAARTDPPDAIVSDVLMPGMDGFELCLELRRDPRLANIPIILVSSHYFEAEDQDLARKVGANALLARVPGSEPILTALLAQLDTTPPTVAEPVEIIKSEHTYRLIRQLERQVHANTGLLHTCALQAAQLAFFRRVSKLSGHGLDALIREALAACLDAAGVSQAAVYLLDSKGKPVLEHAIGFDSHRKPPLESFFDRPDLIGEVVASRANLPIPSPLVPVEFTRRVVADVGTATALLIPICFEGRCPGVLFLASQNIDVTQADAVAFAENLSVEIGQAMALVTAHVQAAAANERYRTLVENANDGVAVLSPDGMILEVNRRLQEILLLPREQLTGRALREFAAPGYTAECLRVCEQLRQQGAGPTFPVHLARSDGAIVVVEFASASLDVDGQQLVLAIGRDITEQLRERKRYEQELEHLANRDSLTGLANRNLLNNRLSQAISYAVRYTHQIAVAFIDLDRFKVVNDSLGHVSGDALLREVAQRVASLVREGDTVARIGGDEFVVVFYDIERSGALPDALQRIIDAVSQPFTIEGNELFVTCSMGIALYPQDGTDPAMLLRNADLAMYQSKEHGGGGYRFYTSELDDAANERLALEQDLRRALHNNEFVLHYQPVVDLARGKVSGAEALVRWQHPQRGIVPPNQFIPIAEETGLIIAIGEWVLRTACSQAKVWLDCGRELTIAVNLSARQFRQPGLPAQIGKILRDCGLPPRLLELELTESMVMEHPAEVAIALAEIRALGVHLSLDDFGTGYSSLSRLKQFPIDTLKIDRAFVQDITSSPDDAAIAVSVIALANALNRRVIAEGVETEAQLNYLRLRHCDAIQGYFFSPPVPAEAFARLLADGIAVTRGDSDHNERTILLVDDEEFVLKALTRVLRRDNYRILTADGAEAGFDLLARHNVQVIISDQRMPGMNGTDFLSRVKELHPNTVRIVLSGYTDLQVVTDAINRGAIYRFLTKPWDDNDLRTNVRDAFRLVETNRQVSRAEQPPAEVPA